MENEVDELEKKMVKRLMNGLNESVSHVKNTQHTICMGLHGCKISVPKKRRENINKNDII